MDTHEPNPATPVSEDQMKPRLLSLRQAAAYLGCSFWTTRDYVLQGLIPVVHMPPLGARAGYRQQTTLRRVLIDRADLDAFIEVRRRGPLRVGGRAAWHRPAPGPGSR